MFVVLFTVIFAFPVCSESFATPVPRRDTVAVSSNHSLVVNGIDDTRQKPRSLHALAGNTPVTTGESRKPPLSLAQPWREANVAEYLVSEKYDGARVWWDGRRFISRGGKQYNAPAWFTASLPDQVLDGELWAGRGQFQTLMRTIRDQQPDDDAWRSVRFMVFDAPTVSAGFAQRQVALAELLSVQSLSTRARSTQADWIEHVAQHRLTDSRQLKQLLSDVIAQGGEGLILQRADATYFPGRHSGFLKLKPYQDAEAVVIGYSPGKGKYTGMTGALIVEDAEGRVFKLGSGLSDKERASPPAVGAEVTYRFQGRTRSGKPRFARYLRVRDE
jgi:DNA ligase-1